MAHTLRYYKEITHADGKVIRIEFHEKDGTAPAMELGDVIQSLNLDLQDENDIDAPITKTMLNFTFVDAPDHAEAKTKKCGAWEEFYSPDATHWKVLLFEVVGGEKMPIWGGYITPDSFREVLTYRAGVSFIARDNIGHMQDFPFDAKGNDDGMITLMGLLTSAWAKIESPMRLNFTSSGADWLRCEDTLALDTYMNVSAFEDKNWYEVFEDVLYSYGLVLRFTGKAEVSVFPLRYLPFYGGDTTTIVNPVFQTGAERELSPAVRRIEESVDYEIADAVAKPVGVEDFVGTIERYSLDGNSTAQDGVAYPIANKESGKGWCNPGNSLFFNPYAYSFANGKDEEKKYMWLACNNWEPEVVGTTISRYAEYSREVLAQNLTFFIKLGSPYAIDGSGSLVQCNDITSCSFSIIAEQGSVKYWYNFNGTWGTEPRKYKISNSGEVEIPLSIEALNGKITLRVIIRQIETTTDKYVGQRFVPVYSAGFRSNKPLLETNNVNTNYSDTNNVILSRNPKIGITFDAVALPAFIKNGIFVRHDGAYVPAKLWSWNGSGAQQMAVYNHLQLLCYHSKPNNIITGTILNADVANHAKLYRWGGAEHLLISGTLDMLTGYIENATLREFVRYEDMWGDLTDTADFPEVEGSSKTTADSGTSSQTTTYSNTTNVTIGGEGGGTIVLDTFMSDSSTNGVQNRVIKAYVDSSIANLINGAPTTLDTLKEIADAFEQSKDVVEALESAIGNKADKNNVYTKEQTYNREHIDGEFEEYENALATKALKSEVYTKDQTYDRTYIDSEFEEVENALAVRALKSEVYTKEDIDGKLTGITTDIDNLESSKADDTKVNAIDDRLKAEEDVTKTYSAWWAALMQYVKVENGNVVIDTNLLVEGESATRGVGDPSTGGGIDENKLAEYLEEYKYINEDALLEYGYATEGYVNNAIDALNIGDYAKTSEVERLFTALNIGQYAKTSDVNASLSNKVDKVSGKGLSTNDFTTALLNKLNGIAAGAEVNVQSDWNATSGDAFIKNKPTLGALAAKDSLTYSDVGVTKDVITSLIGTTTYAPYNANGYLPLNGGTIKGDISLKKDDWYQGAYTTIFRNASTSADYGTQIINSWNGGETRLILSKGDISFRKDGVNNTLIHSGNIGSQFVEGIGTPYANQDINLGKEGKVRMIYGTASNSTTLGYPRQYVSGLSVLTGYSGWQMVTYGGSTILNPYFRSMFDDGTFSDWKQIAFTDSNVASATKLQTARTIWGQSFDGSGNVDGDITMANYTAIKFKNAAGTSSLNSMMVDSSNRLTIGYDFAANSLPTRIDGTSVYLRYGTGHTNGLVLNSSGNVTIGDSDVLGASTSTKFYVKGNTTLGGSLQISPESKIFLTLNVNSSRGSIQALHDGVAYLPITINPSGGNVGIGNSNPQYKLDVNGTARVGVVGDSSELLRFNTDRPWAFYQVGSGASASLALRSLENSKNFIIQNHSGDYIVRFFASTSSTVQIYTTLTISGATTMNSNLTVNGATTINNNLIVYGESASTSDMRFKDVVENKSLSIADIAKAPCFSFTWKQKDDKSLHLGTSAQYWEAIAPELVTGEDFKALNYASLGVAMGIALAKESINHEDRIKNLEDEIKILNGELKRLRYGIHQ